MAKIPFYDYLHDNSEHEEMVEHLMTTFKMDEKTANELAAHRPFYEVRIYAVYDTETGIVKITGAD